jgi:murein DD-endopeptidase MepM/ murein hydrolase activator NlpD
VYRSNEYAGFDQASAPAGVAVLSAAQIRAATGRIARFNTWLEAHCHRIDLAPDLAENIGSKRWFRGLGTMVGLVVAALSFWPDFSAVEAATAVSVDSGSRDEFRSQMIMPLAFGSDSGRRMGALVVPLASAPERPTIQLVATLGQGDSFAGMLQRAGVGPADAARVGELITGKVALGDIGPGTRFDITLGQRSADGGPRPLDKLAFRARFDLDLTIDRRGDGLVLAPRPIAVDATPLRITGAVGESLYRSARAAGAPMKAIQQYLETLDSHLSLDSDIAPSDQFDFVVAYKRSANGESETGELIYAGLERAGEPLAQLLRWGRDGRFYEASGLGSQQAAVYAPVAGRLTSGFGMRRHPILGYSRMHAGVDFGAGYGSPIFAVSDGVVSYAGRHGGHGNYVRLEHGGALGTGYGHMSRIAVSPGDRVQAGQVIGYVGSSGLSTGPHLHYEVYQAGRTVDPLSVRFTVAAQVDAKQQAAFKARLAELKTIQPGAALRSLAPKQAEVALP